MFFATKTNTERNFDFLYSHPRQHTIFEEAIITEVWQEHGRKGIDYVYCILVQEKGYTRSQAGLFHALRRLGLIDTPKKKGRRNYRQCTACEIPGEKVQIDVKVVPYYCIKGKLRREEKSLYQWTAIDECTRARYVHIFEEHTPENSVKFLKMFLDWFPFEVICVQTDNGTEFTYKFISDEKKCPFEAKLKEHMKWTNNKPMRIFKGKSPMQKLKDYIWLI